MNLSMFTAILRLSISLLIFLTINELDPRIEIIRRNETKMMIKKKKKKGHREIFRVLMLIPF